MKNVISVFIVFCLFCGVAFASEVKPMTTSTNVSPTKKVTKTEKKKTFKNVTSVSKKNIKK